MEKFQIFVKNLNNLWSFVEIYAVFVLNSCGEKMTNMRSAVMGRAINEKSTLRSEKKLKSIRFTTELTIR